MRIPVLCLTTFMMVSGFCFSNTIHVPGDQPTIQAGIDAAIENDLVLVAPGTYVENIDFLGKKITVTSEQGANVTIIDGNRNGPVVSFVNGEVTGTYLSGFTITNGLSSNDGGGIYCENSGPDIHDNIICLNECLGNGAGIAGTQGADASIHNNVIQENKAEFGGGGGIYADDSDLWIWNNLIDGNKSGLWLGGKTHPSRLRPRHQPANLQERGKRTEGEGGGIYLRNHSKGSVLGNTISNNKAYFGAGICCNQCGELGITGNDIVDNICDDSGGGIDCIEGSSPVILSNFIARNEITLGGYGGGINCLESDPKIQNNIICRNVNGSHHYYGAYGGGISFSLTSSQQVISNNTIFENYVFSCGGGIASYYKAYPVMTNCILWGNRTETGSLGNEIYVGTNSSPSELTISHCDVDGGLASVYVTSHGQLNWGNGMIDADPLFVDPDACDLHLTYPSPCLDAGDSATTNLPYYDFEADLRSWYDTVDIGADEFFPHVYCMGDFTPGGQIDAKLIGRPEAQPVLLFLSAELAAAPPHTPWGIFYLAQPLIVLGIGGTMPPEGFFVFSGRIPNAPAAPYNVYMQALINDRLTNYFPLEVR